MSFTNAPAWLGLLGLVALACSLDERRVQVPGADGGPLDDQGADSTGPGDDSSLEAPSEDGMGPGQVGGGSDAPLPCVPDASQANVVQLAYGFALGTPPYRVARSDGLLRGTAASTLIPTQLVTERRGTVDIAADGSFSFTPVDAAGFWGDDRVEVALPDGALSHVRLTVHPETLSLAGVEAGTGNGLTVYGESADDVAGGSVVYAGDVNGDGYDDVVVGAYNAGDGLGAAYVMFGTTSTAPVYSRSITLGQAGGFSIVGGSEIGLAGVDVSGAGDLNGDGLDDLMVSAFAPTLSGAASAGAVYIVFGKPDSAPVLLSDIDAGASSAGFAIRGEDAANSGAFAAAGAGDVNGDGWPDLIVGLYSAASTAGEAYVVLGSSAWSNVSLPNLEREGRGFVIRGADGYDRAGQDVAGAGDVNADGLDDVIVGAITADPNQSPEVALDGSGAAYVVFGKRDTNLVSLASLEAGSSSDGFAILGVTIGAQTGNGVAGGGDINGDGFDDVVVGAYRATLNDLQEAGAAYVVYGKADAAPVSLSELADVEPATASGFVLRGSEAGDRVGSSVWLGGDVNADGFDDLVVGATDAYPGVDLVSAGKAYLLLGSATHPASIPVSSVENGLVRGFVVASASESEAVGVAVGGGGDFNADGLSDLIIGANRADSSAGKAHILFGWDATGDVGSRRRTFRGGASDDMFSYAGEALITGDGGNGIDTLRFVGENLSLDLRAPMPRLRNIEVIDITGCGDNTLQLTDSTIRKLPQSRPGLPAFLAKTLVIVGDAGDRVQLDLQTYDAMPDNLGRKVYRRAGSAYGFEISSDVAIQAPP